MATGWFSGLSSSKASTSAQAQAASRPAPAESAWAKYDDADPWKQYLKEKHEGLAADLMRVRVEVKTALETYKLSNEERFRNLERLSDAQGRALKHLLGGASPGAELANEKSGGSAALALPAGDFRTEFDGQKTQLLETDLRMSELYAEVAQLRAEIEGYKGSSLSLGYQDGGAFVPMERYEQDLKTIAVDRDLVMIKAGYLAVASSESTHDEKKSIFENLKKREQTLRDTRPVSLIPLPDTAVTTEPAVAPQSVEPLEDHTFTFEADCSGTEKLGITVNSLDGEALVVEKIGDGLVRSWNKEHFETSVKPGDLIVAVNDVSSGAEAIQNELQKKEVLRIKIMKKVNAPGPVRV